METNTKVQWGVIGLLSLIVSAMGGTIYLNPSELDNAYVCTTNQNVVLADHLSSTSKTAYWTENGVEKSQVCRNGVWQGLKQYSQENNIDINVLIQNIDISPLKNGIQYICDNQKCEVKE